MGPNRVQPHPDLLQYIQYQTSQGWTLDQVVTAAKNSGWPDEQIEACIAWVNNNYVNQQMSVNQVYASSGYSAGTTQQKNHVRAIPKLIAVVCIAGLAAGGFILFGLSSESDQAIFEQTIRNSLRTGTIEQTFTAQSEANQFAITARAESDFRNPQAPRAFIDLSMRMNFNENLGNPRDELEVAYEIIAIDSSVWIRPTRIQIDLSDESRTSFTVFSSEGQRPEDALLAILGIGELNVWQSFSLLNIDDGSDIFGFTGNISLVAQSINTVLGDFIIADAGEQAEVIGTMILDSDMYTLKSENTKRETIDGIEFIIFDIEVNENTLADVNIQIADILDLPDHHVVLLEDAASLSDDSDFKLWVDAKTKLPYKIDVPGQDMQVDYANHGDDYSINEPEL